LLGETRVVMACFSKRALSIAPQHLPVQYRK
jgi:hypothetical protein